MIGAHSAPGLGKCFFDGARSFGLGDSWKCSTAYKMELGITQNPALCIEESSIHFKDMIFEGVVP